jgi:hypothetical protein
MLGMYLLIKPAWFLRWGGEVGRTRAVEAVVVVFVVVGT